MKIVFLSDFDIKGSGYTNICVPLIYGLSEIGHEVKAIGLTYKGEEHNFKFQMLPANNLREACGEINNLRHLWEFDVCVVALDIPVQEKVRGAFPGTQFPYVGIMPVEADPLCFDYAAVLASMTKPLIISKFGTEEAHKAGVENAEHLPIGLDEESWRPPTDDERQKLRDTYYIDDDTFVVLTVADNQERKNLSKSMEMFADFVYDKIGEQYNPNKLEQKRNAKYILVTREENPVGWRLRNYADRLGITRNLEIYERGLDFKRLWGLYALSDVFLLASKAEGLCMPVLEAMSTKTPVIATNCTAVQEHLQENRGYSLEYNYVHVDPFGNGRRYHASREHGAELLSKLYEEGVDQDIIDNAKRYIDNLSWQESVVRLHNILENINSSQNEERRTEYSAIL